MGWMRRTLVGLVKNRAGKIGERGRQSGLPFVAVLWLGVALLGLVAISVPGTASAATIVVDTRDDELNTDGDCSLREAIQAANTDAAVDACLAGSSADTISVPAGTYTLTTSSELAISTDLTLDGAGADTTVIQAATSPGAASWRVFNITAGTVSISDVTVRHGKLADHGAGILNAGTLTVTASTFSDNDSGTTRHGGAINNKSGATLTVVRSTFNGNSASEGGAIQSRGTATISNSTFSGNSASNSGGGFDNIGTGVSTTINNSTFTGNSAGSGGGVFNIFGSVTLNNTIIVGNSGGAAREDCFGSGITSLGHNLVGIGTGCPTGGTDDVTASLSSAKLAALADNGGTTETHALLSGSPAIDAGNPATPGSGGNACESADQRGTSRLQGAACDIGAFEFVAATPVPGLSTWGLVLTAVFLAATLLWQKGLVARRSL